MTTDARKKGVQTIGETEEIVRTVPTEDETTAIEKITRADEEIDDLTVEGILDPPENPKAKRRKKTHLARLPILQARS